MRARCRRCGTATGVQDAEGTPLCRRCSSQETQSRSRESAAASPVPAQTPPERPDSDETDSLETSRATDERRPPVPPTLFDGPQRNNSIATIALFVAALLIMIAVTVRQTQARLELRARAAEWAQQQKERTAVKTQVAESAPPPLPALTPKVQLDDSGDIVRIAGLNPKSVLDAYCNSGDNAGLLQPVEVRAAAPGVAFGIFRDARKSGDMYTIKIRRDRKAGRWILGSGVMPISAAPTLPARANAG
ncbi:MAG: hypothetical protein GY716_16470 [bacterium]|nr:hypothetical protein [bacterium]